MRTRSNSSAYKTFSSVACGTQNTTEQTKPAVASRQRQHRQRQRQQAKLVLASSCLCSCSCSCLRASCSLVLSAAAGAAAVATRSPIRFTVVLFGIRNMCMQATAAAAALCATVEPVRSIMPVWNYNYSTSAREDCGGEYLTL